MGILNIGDFFFAHRSLVTGAYGYSEHVYPFGLDGEFVCRLGISSEKKKFSKLAVPNLLQDRT
jgi:hypothetical protein